MIKRDETTEAVLAVGRAVAAKGRKDPAEFDEADVALLCELFEWLDEFVTTGTPPPEDPGLTG